MKITKIGHCCLLIETKGKRIMTDPGSFTVGEHRLENIDIVLITHEHADHLHVDSLKDIVNKSPDVRVLTNTAVGVLLSEAGIMHEVLEGTDSKELQGLLVEAYDAKHEEIFEEVGQVQNTGYFVDNKLFYPGDAYCEPGKDIEVLALPVGGPWCKLTEALHYALRVSPKYIFPVHDGIEREDKVHIIHGMAERILEQDNIDFRSMKAGDVEEFQE